RIHVDIITDCLQVTVAAAIHNQTLVTSAEQMSEELVPTVEARRIYAQKPFHARDQIGLRGLNQQGKMIGYETTRSHLPARFGATFAQGRQEPLSVLIILKDRLPPVS